VAPIFGPPCKYLVCKRKRKSLNVKAITAAYQISNFSTPFGVESSSSEAFPTPIVNEKKTALDRESMSDRPHYHGATFPFLNPNPKVTLTYNLDFQFPMSYGDDP